MTAVPQTTSIVGWRIAGWLGVYAWAAAGASCSSPVDQGGARPATTQVAQARGEQPAPPPPSTQPGRRVIRVCADPNNLPFSNDKLEGFENRLAALVARDLGADVEYVWRAQRRGFFRHAFKDDGADLVMGVPAGFERALTTAPYYRSTYVFVTRHDKGPAVRSFDDPVLQKAKVGIQITGEDGQNPPPAYALARRGIVDNVIGYTVYGDYTQANPPARLVDAVASGDVDVAVVWGPLAGYFAPRAGAKLDVAPVQPQPDPTGLPFAFSIAVGVRKDGKGLRDEVDAALARHHAEVEKILDEFGVPRVTVEEHKVTAAEPTGQR